MTNYEKMFSVEIGLRGVCVFSRLHTIVCECIEFLEAKRLEVEKGTDSISMLCCQTGVYSSNYNCAFLYFLDQSNQADNRVLNRKL